MRSEELFEGRSSQLHTELMQLRKRNPEKKNLLKKFNICIYRL